MLKDYLLQIRELLEDKQRWTYGISARNAQGFSANACDESATCWSLTGAISKVLGDNKLGFPLIVKYLIKFSPPEESLSSFNDRSTHEDFLNFLDRAIKDL